MHVKSTMKTMLLCILAVMTITMTGCSGSEEGTDTSILPAKEAVTIEDIDWNVTESVLDGQRYISFNYTNNSTCTLITMSIEFRQKEGTTLEQLALFDEEKATYEWTDEEMAEIYILGGNWKCADPGETVSDSPCVINGTLIPVKNMEQFDLMEPDIAEIAYIGKDKKGHILFYDFKSQTYSKSSQGAIDLDQWSDSEICKLLPKANFVAVIVGFDDEDFFSFDAYGVSEEEYEAYRDAVKAKGFTNADIDSENSYWTTNDDNHEVHLGYSPIKEQLSCSISTD